MPDPLLSRAHGAAEVLRGRGARRVAIGPCAADDVVAWLLGADLLGAAALVVSPSWTSRERDAVFDDAGPDVVVEGPPPPSATGVTPHPGPTSLFYLATTSGSSGRPKVLARTRRSWQLGFDALGPVAGPVLVPGPLASSLFLFGTLHALRHGVPVVWRDRLDARDLTDAGTVHLVPAMLSALLDALERDPVPVGLSTIVCGGAHVGDALRARCARLLPDTELVEYYGSAEHSLIALRRGAGPLRPVDGVEVRVRDGELEIRTAQAFAGYLRRGRLEPAGDGFLGVGDRGTPAADGSLVVHGRGSATISTGGTLVAAEEVEDVLRAVPGISDVVVAGTPHDRLGELVTAVVEAPHGAPPLRALRATARAGLAPAKRPRRWLVAARLPRLASGKVARTAVAAGLADGTLDAVPIPATAMISDSVPIGAEISPHPVRTADHGTRRTRRGGTAAGDSPMIDETGTIAAGVDLRPDGAAG